MCEAIYISFIFFNGVIVTYEIFSFAKLRTCVTVVQGFNPEFAVAFTKFYW